LKFNFLWLLVQGDIEGIMSLCIPVRKAVIHSSITRIVPASGPGGSYCYLGHFKKLRIIIIIIIIIIITSNVVSVTTASSSLLLGNKTTEY